MSVTNKLNLRANYKEKTQADYPFNPKIVSTNTYTAVSTLGQTIINLPFSVDQSNTANFSLFVDGKYLTPGASNDYTFTNVASNNTSSQITTNFALPANVNINAINRNLVIQIEPSNANLQSQISTLNTAATKGLTVQRFLSGSGTYTTPTNPAPLYLKIKMVGGGGGGAGSSSSSSNGGAGSAGGDTTFGAFLTAGAGQGGNGGGSPNPSGSSTATANSPAVVLAALSGAQGSSGMAGATGAGVFAGGIGGSSPFGGAGPGTRNETGHSAVTNSGSGGGGAGTSGASGVSGGGGGAGAYVEVIIPNPTTSYAYSVGAGGGGGGAGSGGSAGGTGGSGIIIIEEHYV